MPLNTSLNQSAKPPAFWQRGVSLILALIALAAMSVAALALIRSIDTGTLILGNLGFKQTTRAIADVATEQAVSWLSTNTDTLNTANIANGYYAASPDAAAGSTTPPTFDPTNKVTHSNRVLVDWNNDNCAYATSGTFFSCMDPLRDIPITTVVGSNTITLGTADFIITRLCVCEGDPNSPTCTGGGTQQCAKPIVVAAGSITKRGELKYGENERLTPPTSPFFRIVTRIRDPRGTVSFTETYLHF